MSGNMKESAAGAIFLAISTLGRSYSCPKMGKKFPHSRGGGHGPLWPPLATPLFKQVRETGQVQEGVCARESVCVSEKMQEDVPVNGRESSSE